MKNQLCDPSHKEKIILENLKDEIADFENVLLINEMAGIMSHEIRNPMTTVRGFLQMFMCKPSLAKNQEYLQIMIDELDGVNAIINDFLSVSAFADHDFIPWDLNQIIESITPLIEGIACKEQKFFQTQLQEIPQININMKEIRQLILIMCRNAFDSMRKGGLLTITTKEEQGHIILEIQDEGKGIEAKVLEKIGTPFLTTKEKGTGLGLSVCYSICKRHDAQIEVNTNRRGTTFIIKFKA